MGQKPIGFLLVLVVEMVLSGLIDVFLLDFGWLFTGPFMRFMMVIKILKWCHDFWNDSK